MPASDIAITIDLDWCADFMIELVAERLIAAKVKATWFITHRSPAIEELKTRPDLFELGIHPNFQPGSTHGETIAEVLRHCAELLPHATTIRSHRLFQSTRMLQEIMDHSDVQIDSSIFLPHTSHIQPIDYARSGRQLLRIPYYWEDDFEWERAAPAWRLREMKNITADGLKIFNFHPIHICLNSHNPAPYESAMKLKHHVADLTSQDIQPLICNGDGVRTLFEDIIAHLAAHGNGFCLRDLAAQHQSEVSVK